MTTQTFANSPDVKCGLAAIALLCFAAKGFSADLFAPALTLVPNQNGGAVRSGLAVSDLDGDGHLDVIVPVAKTGEIQWYQGDGSGAFLEHTIHASLNPYSLRTGDIDGDGDVDLAFVWSENNVVASRYGWLENDGFQNFTYNDVSGTVANYDLELADLDGDLDLDIVLAGGRGVSPLSTPLQWHSNQNGTFGNATEIAAVNAWNDFARVEVLDLDVDGLYDIAATMGDSHVAWFKNDGSMGFDSQSLESPDVATTIPSHYQIPRDLNGDGLVDFVGLLNDSNGERRFAWWQNTGNGTFQAHSLETDVPVVGVGFNGELEVADIDLDGDFDVVGTFVDTGTATVRTQAWLNNGMQQFEAQLISEISAPGSFHSDLEVADLDSDGRPDLIVSVGTSDLPSTPNEAGGTWWLKNNEPNLCDFNDDNVCNVEDINLMLQTGPIANNVPVVAGVNNTFDLSGDGIINLLDQDKWLANAATLNGFSSPYKLGDANLDGAVNGADFVAWNSSKFSESLRWDQGDFNADGIVDGRDFVAWNTNKFTSSATPVPDPSQWVWLLALVVKRRGASALDVD